MGFWDGIVNMKRFGRINEGEIRFIYLDDGNDVVGEISSLRSKITTYNGRAIHSSISELV